MRGGAARALAVLTARGRTGRRGGASQLVTILAYAARRRLSRVGLARANPSRARPARSGMRRGARVSVRVSPGVQRCDCLKMEIERWLRPRVSRVSRVSRMLSGQGPRRSGCARTTEALHSPPLVWVDAPGSQTPVWERLAAKLRFAPARSQGRNGVSEEYVPKQEFGNEKKARFNHRFFGKAVQTPGFHPLGRYLVCYNRGRVTQALPSPCRADPCATSPSPRGVCRHAP
jgi:hypothetical protein